MRAFPVLLLLGLAGAAMAAGDRLVFADGLWRRGLHAQAAAEYEALLKEKPEGDAAADIRFRLAECYEAMGQNDRARALYKEAAEGSEGERRFAAQLRLAAAFLEAGQPKEAQPLLEALATGKASQSLRDAAAYRLGVCYEALGRGKDAATLYRLLADKGGDYAAFARLRLADGLGKEGKTKEALALCDALLADATAKDRHTAAGTLAFGLAYGAQDFAAAAAYARKLGAKPLGESGLLLPAAWAAAKAGSPADARAWLAAEKLRSPTPTEDRLWLEGNVAAALGDDLGACTAYERILSEFPEGKRAAGAAEAMLALRAKAGDPKAFLGHAARVARWLTPEARLTLAPFMLDAAVQVRDRKAAAEAAALLADKGEPRQAAEAAYRLAWLLREMGDPAAAGEAWLAAAERWPDTPTAGRAAYAAAYAFRQANLPDRADAALRLALASGDAAVVPDALLLKARGQLAENDVAGAATTLDEYLTRFPEGPAAAEAAYLRGLVFFNAKDFAAAEARLGQALAFGQTEGKGPAPLPHARRTDAALRRAQSLHALGQGDEAAALLQPLLGLKDAEALDPAYLRWLADFRLERKEWAEAEAAAKALAARAKVPADRVLAQTLLGRAAEGQGQAATALAAYEAALAAAQEPTAHDAVAALGVGRLRAAEGAHDKAREAFALAADRADAATAEGRALRAQALTGQAVACAALGLQDEALRADMALIIFFDDATQVPAAFRRAIANLEAQGRTNEAKTLRDEFAQRYPKEKTP